MTLRIYCDFDGTVALGDVTDILLETFAHPSWQAIETEWRSGQIGSATCMARQVELLFCTKETLDRKLDEVGVDPAFAAFAAFCKRIGAALTIVSDGLDYAIKRMLAKAGVDDLPIVANHLLFLGDGRHAMLSPYASADCSTAAGTCKCVIARRGSIHDLRVLIGDGRSDFCVAEKVDFVLAKDRLLDHCRQARLPYAAFVDFSEAATLIGSWLQPPSLSHGAGVVLADTQ